MQLQLAQEILGDKDKYRFGLDNERVAAMLDQLAAGIRAGVIVPKTCEITSSFAKDEWEAGILQLEFNEKVIG